MKHFHGGRLTQRVCNPQAMVASEEMLLGSDPTDSSGRMRAVCHEKMVRLWKANS